MLIINYIVPIDYNTQGRLKKVVMGEGKHLSNVSLRPAKKMNQPPTFYPPKGQIHSVLRSY